MLEAIVHSTLTVKGLIVRGRLPTLVHSHLSLLLRL